MEEAVALKNALAVALYADGVFRSDAHENNKTAVRAARRACQERLRARLGPLPEIGDLEFCVVASTYEYHILLHSTFPDASAFQTFRQRLEKHLRPDEVTQEIARVRGELAERIMACIASSEAIEGGGGGGLV